jgi:hypothetical protein
MMILQVCVMDLEILPVQSPGVGYISSYRELDSKDLPLRRPPRYTWHIERRRHVVRNFNTPKRRPEDNFCVRRLVSTAWTSLVLSVDITYPNENWKLPETILEELSRKMIDQTDELEKVVNIRGTYLCGRQLHLLAHAMAACPYAPGTFAQSS